MWEVGNSHWNLKEVANGTLTLTSTEGTIISNLTWAKVRALNAISAEADREWQNRNKGR